MAASKATVFSHNACLFQTDLAKRCVAKEKACGATLRFAAIQRVTKSPRASVRASVVESTTFFKGSTLHLGSARSVAISGTGVHRLQQWQLCPGPNPQRGGALSTRAAVFDQLSISLENAWKKLANEDKITSENIKEPMKEVRRALLEADVSLPVARRFVANVQSKAIGQEVAKGIKPQQQLIKVVADELKALMGLELAPLVYSRIGPTVILLAGLQGVGKTTAAGKLALYLKKQNKKVMMVATDIYRPAAIDQLVTLGKQVDVPVFEMGTTAKPPEIARKGLAEAKKQKADVVLVDTAGRLQINKDMMNELKEIKKAVKPTEVLLVVDAMTGQEAAGLVQSFNQEVGITGAILTKLDGDSRGGAALSVREVSGKPIKFTGEGEKMTALEPFYPERMAQRILGMGDVLTLVERAEENMMAEETARLTERMMSAKFDFTDMLKQTEMIARFGSMSAFLKLMPGMNKLSNTEIREAEKNAKTMRAVIQSMTVEERTKPELLTSSPSRRRRIARGCGKSERQVSEVVQQLFTMRARMQNLSAIMSGKSAMPGMGDLQQAITGGRKAAPGTAKRKKRRSLLESASEATIREPLAIGATRK